MELNILHDSTLNSESNLTLLPRHGFKANANVQKLHAQGASLMKRSLLNCCLVLLALVCFLAEVQVGLAETPPAGPQSTRIRQIQRQYQKLLQDLNTAQAEIF